MSKIMHTAAAVLALAGLSGCVVAPDAPSQPPAVYGYGGYPPGYAYAPGYYAAPAVGVVGGCWGCGWHRWR